MLNPEEYSMLDFFEKTLDLVCIVDHPGWFKKVNPAVVKTLGYSEDELLARPVYEFIHPDDKEITSMQRSKLLNNEPLVNFQNRYVTKLGHIVWLQWTSVYIPGKKLVFAIAKDITEGKKTEIKTEENYKKYKNLTAHFKHHVEKDREVFALELHEELAQLATVIKMDFESITSQQHLLDDLSKKRIEHGLATSQILINKIRKLSYSINPSRIEEIGLDAVLSSLCREFFLDTEIQYIYKSSFDENVLNNETKLDLLRICQEALLNIMHHAHATQVKITVQERKNKIELSVTDNGKGFDHQSKQRFGLRNMHGRAASINGELIIKSKKSKGTTVCVRVEQERDTVSERMAPNK